MSPTRAVIVSSMICLSVGCSGSQINGTGQSGGHQGGETQPGSGGGVAGTGGDTGGMAGAGGTAGTGGMAGTGSTAGTGGIAGTGGTAGTGATAGTGGMAGTGGVGGAGLPLCSPPAQVGADGGAGGTAGAAAIVSCAYDASAQAVLSSVSAAVMVTSVDQVEPGSCTITRDPLLPLLSTLPSTKIVLASANQHWTVYLNIPDFPADAIHAGDSFDLAITAQTVFWYGPEQLITLSKAGKLVVFGYAGYQRPDLSAFGIALSETASCSTGNCGFTHYLMHVGYGGAAADVDEGQTKAIGNLSFTLERDMYFNGGTPPGGGACDASAKMFLGGAITSQ